MWHTCDGGLHCGNMSEMAAHDFRRTRNRPGIFVQDWVRVDVHRRLVVFQVWNFVREESMRKILAVAALGLVLTGCQTARQDRQLTGGLIGGGAGALIGGVATNSWGGALVGGVVGAAAGAIIADATRPGYCYRVSPSGRKRYFRC
jgi:hypothetical protein